MQIIAHYTPADKAHARSITNFVIPARAGVQTTKPGAARNDVDVTHAMTSDGANGQYYWPTHHDTMQPPR